MSKTRKIAFLGLGAALALILSYVEMLLPPIWSAVPGIKMGLPNIVTVFFLYRFSAKETVAVSIPWQPDRSLRSPVMCRSPATPPAAMVAVSARRVH